MKKISIINIDLNPPEKRRIEMFPNVIRCGIFGPSGGEKTDTDDHFSQYKATQKCLHMCHNFRSGKIQDF